MVDISCKPRARSQSVVEGAMRESSRLIINNEAGCSLTFYLRIEMSKFYLPSKNIIKVLFALLKYHLSSICPPEISIWFYLPSQNIIRILRATLARAMTVFEVLLTRQYNVQL
jgi:hypothetical protein